VFQERERKSETWNEKNQSTYEVFETQFLEMFDIYREKAGNLFSFSDPKRILNEKLKLKFLKTKILFI